MADYRKMYYTLMDAAEKALEILEMKDVEAAFLCRRAAAELIRAIGFLVDIFISSF